MDNRYHHLSFRERVAIMAWGQCGRTVPEIARDLRGHFPYCSVYHLLPPSTILISSSVNPYNPYTNASICLSVAAIWRSMAVLSGAVRK
jgi:hypothetical protein